MQDPNLIAGGVIVVTSPAKCGSLGRTYALSGGPNARRGRSMKGKQGTLSVRLDAQSYIRGADACARLFGTLPPLTAGMIAISA
jgi:hypothetical protein